MIHFCGVDIAKHDFKAAYQDEADSEPTLLPETFPQSDAGFRDLSESLDPEESDTVLLGVESTGGYEDALVHWFRKHTSVNLVVLNALQVKRFAESQLLRTKTDEVDAVLITSYLAANRPQATEFASQAHETLKRLTRHRDHLIQQRAQEKTDRESVKDSEVESSVRETLEFLDQQIQTVEHKISEHLEDHPDLDHQQNLLSSIPGIGDQTAATLISEMKPGLSPKKQVAHAGLAPRACQSGTLEGPSMLSRTGNKRLRKALYMPALAARTFNPIIESFYEKLIAKGKPKMVAICACMRKLLHLAVGVLKNQTPFDPEFREKRLAN